MTRRWQPPLAVINVAMQSPTTPLIADLRQGLPVSAATLEAIVASGTKGPIGEWANNILSKVQQAEDAHITEVLVSSGFDENGCTPQAFGILDPDYDGECIVAVVRADAAPDTWQRITASGWESCDAPTEMPYLDLRGDLLADALETIAAGAALLLHPTDPQAWLSTKVNPQPLNAAAALADPATSPTGDPSAVVYATVDPLNTSAVISLFEVAPGPRISVRKQGAWQPDDGTLQGQLTGINPPPVVAVAPEQVPDVLRQVDDFDSTHPATAAGPSGGQAPQAVTPPDSAPNAAPAPLAASFSSEELPPGIDGWVSLLASGEDHSNHVMVALPIHPELANKMAVPDGEEPSDLHVTMAYLGDKKDLPPHDTILKAAKEWASHTKAIHGVVSGPAQFTAGQPKPVHVALVDSPALPDARQDLVHHLESAGAKVNQEHGYTPHVSLCYGGDPVPTENHDLHFDHAILSYGNETTDLPFLPSDAEETLQPPEPPTNSPIEPITSSADMLKHHTRRVREAQAADSNWEADRTASDIAEQHKRRDFETQMGSRFHVLKSEGHDDSTAASTVRREIEAENDRRDLWEQQRSDSVQVEKERRLRVQPDIRLSQELVQRVSKITARPAPRQQLVPSIMADAVPHTLLPPALFKYWVAGKGALKIRWNVKGDWARCRDHLLKYVKSDYQTKALCSELHKFATGRWTGSKANKEIEGHGL